MAHRDAGLRLETSSLAGSDLNGSRSSERVGAVREYGSCEPQAADAASDTIFSEDGETLSRASTEVTVPTEDGSEITRRTSITFNPQVKHNDGHETLVHEPVLKDRSRGPHRSRSILQELEDGGMYRQRSRTSSDSDRSKFNPVAGEPLNRRRTRRDPSKHQLHTVGNGNPNDTETTGQRRVPRSIYAPGSLSVNSPTDEPEVSLSQALASSPGHFHSLSNFGIFANERPDSPRSHSYEPGHGSSPRRIARRTTVRSASSSSMSPASAFLSQWGREEPNLDPDDEGQVIGDNSEYVIGRQIGYGGFSVVKEAFTIEDDQRIRRAVKIVRKVIKGKSESENESAQNEFEHEVSIWRYLKHAYVLPLITVFDAPFATFCITQLSTGGSLFDLVRKHRRRATSNPTARNESDTEGSGQKRNVALGSAKRYIYQLASAIRYLHQDMRIVHRDIKLENCLLNIDSSASSSPNHFTSAPTSDPSSTGPDEEPAGNILLCDFGLADFISGDERALEADNDELLSRGSSTTDLSASLDMDLVSDAGSDSPITLAAPYHKRDAQGAESDAAAGSLPYAAPELLRTSRSLYSPSVDIWAFGVVAYALLTSELPFSHSFAPKLTTMILKGEWSREALREAIEDQHGEKEAEAALELVEGCLAMDPRSRWDVAQVLGCAFLEGLADAWEVNDGL